MTIKDDVRRLMADYPRIFFACHTRHVRDSRTGQVLSAAQASILDHLDDVEGTPLTLLAEHLGVTASTMSLSIDRLERKGYAARQRDSTDRRRVFIRLTPAGRRIREAKTVLDANLVAAMLKPLAPKARVKALDGLAALADAASAMVRRRGVDAGTWRSTRASETT